MNIGILTYYREINFGANLQALSTYEYLRKKGQNPIFINYRDPKDVERIKCGLQTSAQADCHIQFVDKYIPLQTPYCITAEELKAIISEYKIEAIIIGSDAVMQHHPLRARIKAGKRKPFYIAQTSIDKTFPNAFWGEDIPMDIPICMMSVSSQNSEYNLFGKKKCRQMAASLSRIKYIGVRDNWTRSMVAYIMGEDIATLTPDPVFAFNQNAGHLVPSREQVLKRYHLPERYVLVSLHSQSLTVGCLDDLKTLFNKQEISCVALPMPGGIKFSHNFSYEIGIPLDPIDWYALIKYASGYIGSNMHPVVVSLHNAVPCYSIDNWGNTDFWGRKIENGSSKVLDILSVFGIPQNRSSISKDICKTTASEIFRKIQSFPRNMVSLRAAEMLEQYNLTMNNILFTIQ